ncbi:MAG TPA: methyltransferase domain-containing protein [Chloroflexia bacterium]|nr:methyltransferase domain-containing protein [Chloroflexia bacterium]
MDERGYAKSVNEHYAQRQGIGEAILSGLQADGKDIDNLSPRDLAAVDQSHSRGLEATLDLAEMAGVHSGQSVLDVGGGLGGAARVLAAEFGCRVTVLDLTKEYCRAGEMLTARIGLGDQVTFKVGSALDMPFPDASFDVVWTQHSSMNISNKERLYSEAHRVLRPGGRLALHEVMAGPEQPIHFPVPWATTQEINFMRSPEEIRTLILESGFREVAWVDVTQVTRERLQQRAAAGAPPTALGPHILLGEKVGAAYRNVPINLDERRLEIVEAVFDKE